MRIERLQIYRVGMSLHTPFEASTHGAKELNHLVFRAEADGLTGWGECAAPNDPYYMGETWGTCWHILRDFLVPMVLGKDFKDGDGFNALMERVKGNNFAKAGLEMVALDLLSQEAGLPLARYIGGTLPKIASGVSLGMHKDKAKLIDIVGRYVDEGYRRVKLKIMPGFDLQPLEWVRERWPELPVMADANSAYRLSDAAHLKQLDRFGLMMIEQPLAWDDIDQHAELQAMIKTPVCLDESIRNAADTSRAIAQKACGTINIKAPRVGGLLEAKRIQETARAAGMPVWCGGMHEYGIGRAAAVALCSLPGFSLPGDISGSDKYFAEDIVDPAIVAVRGEIEVPAVPGLGWRPDEDRIRKRTREEMTFKP